MLVDASYSLTLNFFSQQQIPTISHEHSNTVNLSSDKAIEFRARKHKPEQTIDLLNPCAEVAMVDPRVRFSFVRGQRR